MVDAQMPTTIFSGIGAGVAYFVMNLRIIHRNQEISVKNQELIRA